MGHVPKLTLKVAISSDVSNFVPESGHTNTNTHPRRRSVGGHPYINPSTASSAARFTTPNVPWPQNSGSNLLTDSSTLGYGCWSSDTFTPLRLEVPQNQYSAVSTYVEYTIPTSTTNPTSSPWPLPQPYTSTIHLGPGYGAEMDQTYPSPRGSDGSGDASPLCPSLPPNLSPIAPNTIYSPSTGHDSQNDGRSNQEPPRNPKGEIFCSHEECSHGTPPTFSRKCEWT